MVQTIRDSTKERGIKGAVNDKISMFRSSKRLSTRILKRRK